MLYKKLIMLAAAKIGVPFYLLLGICSHESGLRNIYVPNDNGTPSIGICQIKSETAKMLKHKGTKQELMNPEKNVTIAALYLKYQLDRYDNNPCQATAAYNAGTFFPSKKYLGRPVNYGYIKKVNKHLKEQGQKIISCEQEFAYGN